MILATRERYGYLLNLFMFRGQFNQSLGNSLADLRPPTAAPADFVVPEEAVAEKKAAVVVKKAVVPPAKVVANKKSTDDSVDNFHKVEKYIDTIDLYDDDDASIVELLRP